MGRAANDPFSTLSAKTRETIVPEEHQTSPGKSAGAAVSQNTSGMAQDMVQRQAAFQPLGFTEKPSIASLKEALQHYEHNKEQAAIPVPKKPLERLAHFFIPTPDPNTQKFNDLHTLYSKAIHVCGDSLRPLISEDDMQQTLETVWKTGKVNMGTLELYETTILGTVQKFLEV